MKTTDLIPILLYQLKDGDKYGLELVEACKDCSNNKIEIKQPSLYSILKKLEKSRFVSSYWKDSDIGGKRHYFKITENGLSQLETYPPLEELVKLALIEDVELNNGEEKDEEENILVNEPISEKPVTSTTFEFTFDSIGENKKEFKPVDEQPALAKDEPILEELEPINDEVIEENNIIFEELNKDETELDDDITAINEDIIEPEEEKIEEFVNEDVSQNEELSSEPNLLDNISFNLQDNTAGEIALENSVLTFNERKFEPVNRNNSFDIFDALSYADDEIIAEDNLTAKIDDETKDNPPLEQDVKEKIQEQEIETKLEDKLINFDNNGNIKPNKNKEKTKEQIKTEDKVDEEIKPKLVDKAVELGINFTEYEDFSTSSKLKNSKQFAKQHLLSNIISSCLGLILIGISFFIALKTNITTTYAIFSILLTFYIVFKCCRFIGHYHKYCLSLLSNQYVFNWEKSLLKRVFIVAIILIILVIINLAVIKKSIFSSKNLANFLLPMIETCYFLVEFCVLLICFRTKKDN